MYIAKATIPSIPTITRESKTIKNIFIFFFFSFFVVFFFPFLLVSFGIKYKITSIIPTITKALRKPTASVPIISVSILITIAVIKKLFFFITLFIFFIFKSPLKLIYPQFLYNQYMD